MSACGFDAEVVETKELGIAIVLDGLIADVVEAKHNVPTGDDFIGTLVGDNVFHQFHEAGLAATHGSGEEEALIGVDAQLCATGLVLDEVEAEPIENLSVLSVNLELFAEQELSLGIEINQDFLKIVVNFPALKGAQWVLDGSFCDDMWSMVLHRGSL